MTLVIAREVKKEMHIVVCMRGENILVIFTVDWLQYRTFILASQSETTRFVVGGCQAPI